MSDALDGIRIGDAERAEAVAALGEHFALGRLDQEEFDTRVRAAYAGRIRADLRGLFTDLPGPAPFPAVVPPARGVVPYARGAVPARRVPPAVPLAAIVAVFATVSLIVGFPVFPLLFLLLFVAWRTGAIGHRRTGPWGAGPWDRRALR
jgi:hypothetical protein